LVVRFTSSRCERRLWLLFSYWHGCDGQLLLLPFSLRFGTGPKERKTRLLEAGREEAFRESGLAVQAALIWIKMQPQPGQRGVILADDASG
jgi:hypothetical protein